MKNGKRQSNRRKKLPVSPTKESSKRKETTRRRNLFAPSRNVERAWRPRNRGLKKLNREKPSRKGNNSMRRKRKEHSRRKTRNRKELKIKRERDKRMPALAKGIKNVRRVLAPRMRIMAVDIMAKA